MALVDPAYTDSESFGPYCEWCGTATEAESPGHCIACGQPYCTKHLDENGNCPGCNGFCDGEVDSDWVSY